MTDDRRTGDSITYIAANVNVSSRSLKKHACKAGVYTPARVASDKYVVVIDDLIGRNFSKSNARVILEVSERISDRRHLIDS